MTRGVATRVKLWLAVLVTAAFLVVSTWMFSLGVDASVRDWKLTGMNSIRVEYDFDASAIALAVSNAVLVDLDFGNRWHVTYTNDTGYARRLYSSHDLSVSYDLSKTSVFSLGYETRKQRGDPWGHLAYAVYTWQFGP